MAQRPPQYDGSATATHTWIDENGLVWAECQLLFTAERFYSVTNTDGNWGYGPSVSAAYLALQEDCERSLAEDQARQGRNYAITCEFCAERTASLILDGYYTGPDDGDARCCGECFDRMPCPTTESRYTVRAIICDTAPLVRSDAAMNADVCEHPGCLGIIYWEPWRAARYTRCPLHHGTVNAAFAVDAGPFIESLARLAERVFMPASGRRMWARVNRYGTAFAGTAICSRCRPDEMDGRVDCSGNGSLVCEQCGWIE